jgi:hypothetical protein
MYRTPVREIFMFKFLNRFFKYSKKKADEFFMGKELETVNYEIVSIYERLRNLERKKEKIEIILFGV